MHSKSRKLFGYFQNDTPRCLSLILLFSVFLVAFEIYRNSEFEDSMRKVLIRYQTLPKNICDGYSLLFMFLTKGISSISEISFCIYHCI